MGSKLLFSKAFCCSLSVSVRALSFFVCPCLLMSSSVCPSVSITVCLCLSFCLYFFPRLSFCLYLCLSVSVNLVSYNSFLCVFHTYIFTPKQAHKHTITHSHTHKTTVHKSSTLLLSLYIHIV